MMTMSPKIKIKIDLKRAQTRNLKKSSDGKPAGSPSKLVSSLVRIPTTRSAAFSSEKVQAKAPPVDKCVKLKRIPRLTWFDSSFLSASCKRCHLHNNEIN